MKTVLLTLLVLFLAFLAVPKRSVNAQMTEDMHGGVQEKESPAEADTEDEGDFVKEVKAGMVTVKIEYVNPLESVSPVFKVTFDTHSVELDKYNFEDVTELRDAGGKAYKAELVSTEGSGHHKKGTVVFNGVDVSSSGFVEVAVKGVAGVKEVVVRFDLTGVR